MKLFYGTIFYLLWPAFCWASVELEPIDKALLTKQGSAYYRSTPQNRVNMVGGSALFSRESKFAALYERPDTTVAAINITVYLESFLPPCSPVQNDTVVINVEFVQTLSRNRIDSSADFTQTPFLSYQMMIPLSGIIERNLIGGNSEYRQENDLDFLVLHINQIPHQNRAFLVRLSSPTSSGFIAYNYADAFKLKYALSIDQADFIYESALYPRLCTYLSLSQVENYHGLIAVAPLHGAYGFDKILTLKQVGDGGETISTCRMQVPFGETSTEKTAYFGLNLARRTEMIQFNEGETTTCYADSSVVLYFRP